MRDCEHGSLARSCEVCDLRAEVKRLREQLSLRDECAHGIVTECRECGASIDNENFRLRIERDRLTDGIRAIAARRCLCHGHSINRHGGPCCGVAGGRCVTCEARSLLDVAGDDPPVPYRALEGSEGGEDG